ncbi:MAG: cation diffusion facilitator family transporter, partial [Acidimicrobiales bacterium]
MGSHHAHDGHDHSHGSIRAGERHKGRLALAFGLLTTFMVVEVVGGVVTNSLALLSDAGHMLTDVLGLGMALAAIAVADRHQRATAGDTTPHRHTFGLYRLEILAAFVNSLLLFGVAIYVLVEAIRRLNGDPEVAELPMLVVATLGL